MGNFFVDATRCHTIPHTVTCASGSFVCALCAHIFVVDATQYLLFYTLTKFSRMHASVFGCFVRHITKLTPEDSISPPIQPNEQQPRIKFFDVFFLLFFSHLFFLQIFHGYSRFRRIEVVALNFVATNSSRTISSKGNRHYCQIATKSGHYKFFVTNLPRRNCRDEKRRDIF